LNATEAARNALEHVLKAKKGESIAILCDDVKNEIGEAFAKGALKLGLQTHLAMLKTQPNVSRTEMPVQVKEITKNHEPNIYINLFRGSRKETPFRIKITHMETQTRKARIGHCPGVTLDMLTEGALALETKDHTHMQQFAKRLIGKLDQSVKVEIASPSGTKLSMNVEGRPFFTDTIIDSGTMMCINLPTGEVTVAPVEDSVAGVLVCDMAIGGIGPIKSPVKLTVHGGKVHETESEDTTVLKGLKESLQTDERSDIAGEFAFGINPKARFVEEFLEAEKVMGTIHVAFGNNSDMPRGKNKSGNHTDLLVSKPTVRIFKRDGSSMNPVVDGVFQQV
jgi:leucyl aminopeptidase (aminopeptidase T)